MNTEATGATGLGKRFFTMAEVAEELNVCEDTIKQWRKPGVSDPSNFTVYVTFIGKKPIVSKNNLERFLDGLPPVNSVGGGE